MVHRASPVVLTHCSLILVQRRRAAEDGGGLRSTKSKVQWFSPVHAVHPHGAVARVCCCCRSLLLSAGRLRRLRLPSCPGTATTVLCCSQSLPRSAGVCCACWVPWKRARVVDGASQTMLRTLSCPAMCVLPRVSKCMKLWAVVCCCGLYTPTPFFLRHGLLALSEATDTLTQCAGAWRAGALLPQHDPLRVEQALGGMRVVLRADGSVRMGSAAPLSCAGAFCATTMRLSES